MLHRPTIRRAFAALPFLAGLWCATAQADDIDIYGVAAGTAQVPNVLVFLDNTSNWSAANQAWNAGALYTDPGSCRALSGAAKTACITAWQAVQVNKDNIESVFYYGIPTTGTGSKKRPWDSGFSSSDDVKLKQGQVEVRALRTVLNTFICSGNTAALKIKLGIMFFNDQGSVRSNGDSPGYIRQAVRQLAGTATTAGSTCKTLIDDLTYIDANITNPGFKGPSNADYGSAFFEAFKYFGGYTNPGLVASNTAGAPTGGQGYGPRRFSNATSYEDPDAFTDASKTTYKSPIGTDGECGRSYIILVGNGYPNAEPSGPATFAGLGYTPPTITADPSRYADEWAQFLANTDVSPLGGVQRVWTYAMNVYNTQPSAAQANLLRSMANAKNNVGSAGYIEVNGDVNKIIDAFKDIITSVASVNSVFTATTLPVSTTTQGSYLNQLFIGMFRPDGDAKPRWVGNLKQYKLGMDASSGDIMVVDANSRAAVLHGGSGFFDPKAESFWSTSSVYFNNKPSGTPESISDLPDGQIVEKGGVAQQIRKDNLQNASGRNVYTLPLSPSTGDHLLSATPFSTGGSLPFSTDEINWIRGENNVLSGNGAEFNGAYMSSGTVTNLGTTGARPSIHGDILHSRPVAVNYGSSRGVVVFYGSNDGMLRAVDGNQTGTTAGHELWSFVAPEHYPMLKRERDDRPELYLPTTTSTGGVAPQIDGTQKKDYAFDGPMGLFARYGATTGNLVEGWIYAAMRRGGSTVYAFDVTNPAAPTYKWKVSSTTTGFDKLAQTWSMPRPVIFPADYSVDPYIVMGGGYDSAEDTNGSNGVGNRVYVINARTGAKLAELVTEYSVPSDVTVVDTNGDRKYDRGYVADVRGNLYRINMADSSGTLLPVAAWTIKKIAALGGKVFHAPDVVVTRDYVAVLVGTGDREKPLMVSSNDNFFLVKDTLLNQADRAGFVTKADLTRVAQVDESSPNVAQFTNVNNNVTNASGCYLQLGTNGEKVVNTPFTIAGATYFGTNRPTPSDTSCDGSRGQARSYQFPLFCGVPKGVVLDGGGMPPSPVGGLVSITTNGQETLVRASQAADRAGAPAQLLAHQRQQPLSVVTIPKGPPPGGPFYWRMLRPEMSTRPRSTPKPPRDAPPAPDESADARELDALRRAAADCRECPIGFHATQTVWGEGPLRARLMLVGEQPGDQEDRQGHPFVGPAGQLLDRALQELGWSREAVYVTNAVKHFKFEMRGKRRMHKTPAQREAAACLHWLESEIQHVRPQAIVALGATAARQLMGHAVPVMAQRGHWLERADGLRVLITLHPSALLRVTNEDRAEAYALWLDDLRQAAKLIGRSR